MDMLHQIATMEGVAIKEIAPKEDFPQAFYIPKTRTIYIQEDLPTRHKRALLAHELGHVFYGHHTSTPKAEKQADSFAAMTLIDPVTYKTAERLYGENIDLLAYELDVTPRIVRAFRDCISRKIDQRKNNY